MPFMTLLPSPETRRRWSWKLLGHGAGMCWVQWKSRKASYSLLKSFAWLYATIIKQNMRFHGCKHLSSACFGRMVYFYVAWLQELGADAGFVWFCGCQAQYIDKRSAHWNLQGIAISLGFCFGAVGSSMAAFGLRGCRRDMTWLFGKDGFRPIYRCLWSVHDGWVSISSTSTHLNNLVPDQYLWDLWSPSRRLPLGTSCISYTQLTTQCPLTSPSTLVLAVSLQQRLRHTLASKTLPGHWFQRMQSGRMSWDSTWCAGVVSAWLLTHLTSEICWAVKPRAWPSCGNLFRGK